MEECKRAKQCTIHFLDKVLEKEMIKGFEDVPMIAGTLQLWYTIGQFACEKFN